MRSFLAAALIAITTVAAIAEIISFTINNGSFILQTARDLREWLRPAETSTPSVPTPESCESLKNLFERKLCEDKRSGNIRTSR